MFLRSNGGSDGDLVHLHTLDTEADADQQQGDQGESDEQDKQQESEQSALEDQEADLSEEQWLRRIPDDPGGLLRRKFEAQIQQRLREGKKNYEDRDSVW